MRLQGGMTSSGQIIIDGEPRKFPSTVSYVAVDDRYFRTMGMPVLRGRDFTPEDTATSPLVVIVSESFGRMLAKGGDPVGHKITETNRRIDQPFAVVDVVGVVPDVVTNVAVLEPLVIYYSFAQKASSTSATLVMRAASDPVAAMGEARSVIRQLDPAVKPASMLTMQERIGQQMGPQRFGATVLGMLGMYVLAESMAAGRQREMGIRAALGATRTALGGLVLTQTVRLVGLGLLIGFGLAWIGAGTIRSFLFQVQPFDPTTLVAVSATILGLAVAVSLKPAIAAARMDVARVLRDE
jgi:hypothetical protein